MSTNKQKQAAQRAAARSNALARKSNPQNAVTKVIAVPKPVSALMPDMSTWNKFQLARDFPHRWFEIAEHHGWGPDSCREPTQNIPGKVIGITSTYELTCDSNGNLGQWICPAYLKDQALYLTDLVERTGTIDRVDSNKLTELLTTYSFGAFIGGCARAAASKVSNIEATGKIVIANVPPAGLLDLNASPSLAAPTYSGMLAYDYQQGKGSEEVHLAYAGYSAQPVMEMDNLANAIPMPSGTSAGSRIYYHSNPVAPPIHALKRLDARARTIVGYDALYTGGVIGFEGIELAGTGSAMMGVAVTGAASGDKYEVQVYTLMTLLPKNNSVVRTTSTLGAASAGITRPSTVTSRSGGGFDWGAAASDAVKTVSRVASATTAAAGLAGSFMAGPEMAVAGGVLSSALNKLGAVAANYLDA